MSFCNKRLLFTDIINGSKGKITTKLRDNISAFIFSRASSEYQYID